MRNGGATSRYEVNFLYYVCPRGQDVASISHHCANTNVSSNFMGQPSFYIIVLISATLHYGCSPDNNSSTSNKSTSTSTNIDVAVQQPTNSTDEDFTTFLKHFSTDRDFQFSRIKFPMKVKTNDADYQLQDEILEKKSWHTVDFTYDPNDPMNEYRQKITLTGDKAVIECVGIDNGIMADYYFERKNGLWFLVTLTDAST